MLAVGGRTDDPYMTRVIKAQQIYQITGRAIDPWDADEYPDDWFEAIKALAYDVPRKVSERQKQQAKFSKGKR